MNAISLLRIPLVTLALFWWPTAYGVAPEGPFFEDGFEGIASVCGDGVTSGNEVCDDFNNLSCGTCRDNCTVAVTPEHPAGTIVVVAASNLDGGTFSMSDGTHPYLTFEFDTNTITNEGNFVISLSPADSASQVKTKTIAAINARPDSELEMTAIDVATTLVGLVNHSYFTIGNVPLQETVSDAGFLVSGMSGGKAGDCPMSTSCNFNTDCASNDCQNHVCD